ncbi:MAG: lamin tail domain-containing protein [Chloroflexi bacterium]|nr:MAG: lamin tail domain-containing protein [Chloroflexota bacterium]
MSGIMSLQARVSVRVLLAALLSLFITVLAIGPAIAQFEPMEGAGGAASDADTLTHLVVSELVTGGASASDEFVEVYNPSPDALPLEGLELVYVSASGATVTRKAAWTVGAPLMPPGAHWLVANTAGLYAPMADTTYANGLAATGGSVALRIQGATTAIDAVGWGTATSTWLEGVPAPAAPAGSSLERLPGGLAGSGQDTDDNSADFVARATPDPQNAAAAPIASPSPSPSATPTESASPSASPSVLPSPTVSPSITESPSPSATPITTPSPSASATPGPTDPPSPSPSPSVTPSSTPSPGPPISIAEARTLPDGTVATISGVALSGSDFTDGGGCLVDETAGIALLLSSGTFARGDQLLVTGSIGDRYAQRTLRSSAAEMTLLGAGSAPGPAPTETGAIGEETECELVRISATIVSSPTSLTSGIAFDVDDGSGPVRVLVAPGTGIDTTEWMRGAHLALIGVAGQRDSSGTDFAGYRVLPRDAVDILELVPPSTPTPSPTASPSPTPTASLTGSPTPSPSASQTATGSPSVTPSPSASIPPVISIREARAVATGSAVHVRGVVTLGSGIVDGATAVIQDASAAIALRLSDNAGTMRRGRLVDVVGVRSTKAGMLTIRVEKPPIVVGAAVEPAAAVVATGGAGERLEARLLIVHGTVTSTPVRSTAGNVAFTIDDGSGPLRVTLFAASGIHSGGIARGAVAEVRGILGQQTTGQQPERGYRLWPRDSADLHVSSTSASNAGSGDGATSVHSASSSGAAGVGAGQSRVPRLADEVVGSASGTAGIPPGAAASDGGVAGGSLGSGGAGRPGNGVLPPDARASNAPMGENGAGASLIEPLAARRLSSKYASVLLLTALALTVLMGVLAWRTGALGRLRLVLERMGDGETTGTDAALDSAPWGTTRNDGGEQLR